MNEIHEGIRGRSHDTVPEGSFGARKKRVDLIACAHMLRPTNASMYGVTLFPGSFVMNRDGEAVDAEQRIRLLADVKEYFGKTDGRGGTCAKWAPQRVKSGEAKNPADRIFTLHRS